MKTRRKNFPAETRLVYRTVVDHTDQCREDLDHKQLNQRHYEIHICNITTGTEPTFGYVSHRVSEYTCTETRWLHFTLSHYRKRPEC